MSKIFLNYLERERDRLEALITIAQTRPKPDQFEITRLKKLKLAVRHQFADFQMGDTGHGSER